MRRVLRRKRALEVGTFGELNWLPGQPLLWRMTKDDRPIGEWEELVADRSIAEAVYSAQKTEPVRLSSFADANSAPFTDESWAYRGVIVSCDRALEQGVGEERAKLLVKHHVLRREHKWERMKREIQGFENLDKVSSAARERISEEVRLFVWQRDGGKCVLCGSREKLEFDHIIPVSAGGSNTERNIQLLCEPCNRSKGSRV